MDRLEMTLLEVGATRSCGLLTVVGEAGRREVPADPRVRDPGLGQGAQPVLRGRCLPYGDGVTFWPLAEIVREAAGITDEDPLDSRSPRSPTSRGAWPVGPTIRRRSPTGSPRRSACPPPSSRGRSCSGGSASCSRRSPAGARWSRSSTTSIRGADVPRAARPPARDRPRAPRSSSLGSARHELFETHAEWAEGHEGEHIVLEPLSSRRRRRDRRQLLGRPRGVASATGS